MSEPVGDLHPQFQCSEYPTAAWPSACVRAAAATNVAPTVAPLADLLRDAPTMFHSTNLSGCWSKEALVVSASGVEVLLSFQAQ